MWCSRGVRTVEAPTPGAGCSWHGRMRDHLSRPPWVQAAVRTHADQVLAVRSPRSRRPRPSGLGSSLGERLATSAERSERCSGRASRRPLDLKAIGADYAPMELDMITIRRVAALRRPR